MSPLSGKPTSEERVNAAIALEETDRVVLGSAIDGFAARYAGITQQEWWFDHAKANAALVKTFQDVGPWDTSDTFAPGHPLAFALTAPMGVRLPGRDLAPDTPMQFEEREFMVAEDYDDIIEHGFDAFLARFFPRLGIDPNEVPVARAAIARHGQEDGRLWRDLGVYALCGAKLRPPYDWFSYARSLSNFVMDLFHAPQKVIAAMDVALSAMLESTKNAMRGAAGKGVFIPMARGSVSFISPKQFERFCFPWIKRIADALVAEGYVPVFHCDSNWTPLLPYFRQLPARRCVLQLDEGTDILQAKQVLGDHMCLWGNVSSTLLSLATPDEVERHCRHLVRIVGEGGGFILAPACTMPVDAKAENVKAMARAVLNT